MVKEIISPFISRFSGLIPAYETLFVALAIFLGSITFGHLVSYIIKTWAMKTAKKTKTKIDDIILLIIEKPLIIFAYVFGAWIGLYVLGLNPARLGAYYAIYKVFLIIAVGYCIFLGVNKFWVVFEKYRHEFPKTFFIERVIPVIKKVFPVALWMFVGFLVLSELGIDIRPILAGAGIIGLALALAAQPPLSNYFAGVLIAVDEPFTRGNRIEIPGKYKGDVVKVGALSTKIKTLDNNIVIIPNSQMIATEVINHDLTDNRVILRLNIGVEYGTDADKVKQILKEIAESIDGVVEGPDGTRVRVHFMEFGDCALLFRLMLWIKNTRLRLIIRDEINRKIQKRFKEEGINIPFPIREVYLHNTR